MTRRIIRSLLTYQAIGLLLSAIILISSTYPRRADEVWLPMVVVLVIFGVSIIQVLRWNSRFIQDSDGIVRLQSELLKKRGIELFLVAFGVVTGSLSLFLPLGMAMAGVCLAATGAYLLFFTLKAEWEIGLLNDNS